MTADPAQTVWLFNGSYGALLTAAGTGFSLFTDHLLTNWEDDPCRDEFGFTVFLREAQSAEVWTACGAAMPGCDSGTIEPQQAGAILARRHGDIVSRIQLEVLADAPVERRRLSLTNLGANARSIELTGYLEVVLNLPAAHAAHPVFSKLFVQTSRHETEALLLATRRPRANGESHPAMALGLIGAAAQEWETDRARFLGRGRTLSRARALRAPLSGSTGKVLDPVLALRTVVSVPPGATATCCFVIAAGAQSARLIDAYRTAGTDARLAPAQLVNTARPGARAAAGPAASEPELPLWRRLTLRCLSAARPATAVMATTVMATTAIRSPAAVQEQTTLHGPTASPGDRENAGIDRAANGFGSFSPDGREYRLQIRREADGGLRLPPMPWTNVIANEDFGLIASETGSLATFAGNSRLFRLTPWSNDPLLDPHEEAFYARDADGGEFWSLLPGPAADAERYEVAHGFGYSRWQHRHRGLEHAVVVFVPRGDALRVADIRLRNTGETVRRLALYAYNRWVLGATPADVFGQVCVEIDAPRRAVLARNPKAGAFSGTIAFAAFAGGGAAAVDACIDRARFLGTPGSAHSPMAVRNGGALCADAGTDPCAALRIELSIEPGREIRLAALLGAAGSEEELDELLARYRGPEAADEALAAVQDYWTATHAQLQINTPVAAIDLMINGWLGYQAISCRLWARSAFYQSGGAFGFRDQLQDSAALALTEPQVLRAQILRSAAHQFVEGDVLHWWHPPEDIGVRTRFADDLVWLPYLTAHYLAVTGDRAVLQEPVPYVAGAELGAGEDERYFQPSIAAETGTLYEHCVKALERAMTCGAHGLPLFGGGDWNDGMNRVGHGGRGESVWMGFFLYQALGDFIPYCRTAGDAGRVERFEAYRARVAESLNEAGWDGSWYRRGYYDDGSPLGSALSDECKIDALAQAWAIMTKLAPPQRAAEALDSLEKHLISDEGRVIRLLAPPFEGTPQDPGYIKGYVAGVRENGGQYTHAALWVVRAMAEAGRRSRAAKLLEMLSPVTHTSDAAGVERYQVEPYVIAADVYGVAPHVGRGGWTWYTGSAGWMMRVTIESILGFGIEDGQWLRLAPRIPDEWPGFRLMHRRPDGTGYQIEVENPRRAADRVAAASLDGAALAIGEDGLRVPLAADRREHVLRVVLGPR